MKVFIDVNKLKKDVCIVCNEYMGYEDMVYLRFNQTDKNFMLIPVHRKCLRYLLHLPKLHEVIRKNKVWT